MANVKRKSWTIELSQPKRMFRNGRTLIVSLRRKVNRKARKADEARQSVSGTVRGYIRRAGQKVKHSLERH